MARTATTGIVFILGVLSVLLTFFILGIGLFYMFVGIDGPDPDGAGIMFMCTGLCLALNVVFIGGWYVRKTKEDRIDDLASYLRLYRRTSIETVAQRLGMDTKKAEKVLLECISKGVIHGFLDRNTGEFILEKSIETQREGAKCPNCGGFTNVVTLPGEVLTCQYCAAIIPNAQKGQSVPPPPPPGHVPDIPQPPRGTRIMICTGCRREVPIDSKLCPYCGNRF